MSNATVVKTQLLTLFFIKDNKLMNSVLTTLLFNQDAVKQQNHTILKKKT